MGIACESEITTGQKGFSRLTWATIRQLSSFKQAPIIFVCEVAKDAPRSSAVAPIVRRLDLGAARSAERGAGQVTPGAFLKVTECSYTIRGDLHGLGARVARAEGEEGKRSGTEHVRWGNIDIVFLASTSSSVPTAQNSHFVDITALCHGVVPLTSEPRPGPFKSGLARASTPSDRITGLCCRVSLM